MSATQRKKEEEGNFDASNKEHKMLSKVQKCDSQCQPNAHQPSAFHFHLQYLHSSTDGICSCTAVCTGPYIHDGLWCSCCCTGTTPNNLTQNQYGSSKDAQICLSKTANTKVQRQMLIDTKPVCRSRRRMTEQRCSERNLYFERAQK